MTNPLRLLLVLPFLGAVASAGPAHAQSARTFLSASGSDTNICSRTAPCRTFQGAHNKTNAGGEINVLDPAGYGTVTITKAISIVNDGVGSAGVLVPSGQTGITITAGATDAVNLRGLIIEGAGVGQNGIQFNVGKSLTIENCVVRNLTADGIDFVPNASSTLAVSNTLVANTPGAGIYIGPSGSGITAKAVLNRVETYYNDFGGVFVQGAFNNGGTITVTVADSVASGNPGAGYWVYSYTGAVTSLLVTRSVAANNASAGIRATGPNSTLRLAQSTVTGNAVGWEAVDGGTLLSYGDNYIDGNTSGETAPTGIPPK